MYYQNYNGMGNMNAVDFSSLLKTGQNIASAASGIQQIQSNPQFMNDAERVISDVEMYVYVQLGLQMLVSGATFGLFLIALYNFIKDRKK